MRGSPVSQVHELFKVVNRIGTSKHEAKLKAHAEGAATWHQVGKKLGVYSYAALDACRDVARRCLVFAREHHGIRDIEKMTGEAVRDFLLSKVDQGVAIATFRQYAAGIEKSETALNLYAEQKGTGLKYDFSTGIREARQAAAGLAKFEGSRAYRDSDRLVGAIGNEKHNLVGLLQSEGGCRFKEASHIKESQLRGLREDPHTGEMRGWLQIRGKGGRIREIAISPGTYDRLQSAVAGGALFEVEYHAYLHDLRGAAAATDQEYEGSHGLRWSWAQNFHRELQEHGWSYDQSLSIISERLGHSRSDISTHYLK